MSNVAESAIVDDELMQILAAIEHALDDKEEGEHEEEGYERRVCVHFPDDCPSIFGVGYLEIPIRDFLTWAAKENVGDSRLLLNIRDEYYYGDHEEDYYYQLDSGPVHLLSREELAVKRLAHERGRAEREAERQRFESEMQDDLARDEARRAAWAIEMLPFSQEGAELEEAREASRQLNNHIDDEWDRFVLERETWPTELKNEMEKRERSRLAKLEEEWLEESQRVTDEESNLIQKAKARAEHGGSSKPKGGDFKPASSPH